MSVLARKTPCSWAAWTATLDDLNVYFMIERVFFGDGVATSISAALFELRLGEDDFGDLFREIGTFHQRDVAFWR